VNFLKLVLPRVHVCLLCKNSSTAGQRLCEFCEFF
jgi:hypothetical protein